MSTPSLRRVRILSAAIALGALAACGGGSSPTPPPPPPTSGPTDLSIAVTAPTDTISPGKKAPWTVVVTNNGTYASGALAITNVVDATSTIAEIHCKASANAHCPSVLAASMTGGELPAGESLSFEVDIVVTAGTTGTVYLSSSVSTPNESAPANNTQTVTANVQSNSVSVSNVAAGLTIPAGQTSIFTATIANSGPAVATNVSISGDLSTPLKSGPVTCVATGGATCPTQSAFPLTVDSLPVGGTLTLSIAANVPESYRGTATSTVGVKDDNDSNPDDNTAIASTTVVDGRSGSYELYASNALVYTMTVDFDAKTYAVSGNGVDASGALTTTDSITYAISSDQEIRAAVPANDLLVGAYDFGAGPKAFIAARSFATTVDDIGTASFTVFGLSTNHLGTTDTTIESQLFDASGTMTDCTSTTQIYREGACPDSFKASYALTFSGADITGVDSVGNDTIHIRVAKSGASRIALRSETDTSCNCARFSVGVTDNVLALSGTFGGASSIGSTGGLKLTDTSYAASWLSAAGVSSTDTATLGVQGSSAPIGLRGGVRASDGSFIYVVENAPVALVVGAVDGAANGTMELWGQ